MSDQEIAEFSHCDDRTLHGPHVWHDPECVAAGLDMPFSCPGRDPVRERRFIEGVASLTGVDLGKFIPEVPGE